jgi:radical SAM superfamily enzyme YgiQ (UPF0313 family)
MKVLFALHDLGFADHISIAHLSAIAKQDGHQTYFSMLDSLTPCLDTVKPDVVAYSANVLGYQRVVEANARARMKHRFISIMGGAQATFSPETFPESGMDAYCVGEGDYVIKDFLANIDNFHDVPNLITRLGPNPSRPLIRDLDELPPADRDLVLSNSFLGKAAKKTFYATRGCPFNCAYCCNSYYHKLYSGQPTMRRFSVQRLITEILDVQSKYRMDFVKFGDDCFTIRADDWLEEFASEYARLIAKPFNCYLRVDTIDDKMLSLLRKAGCYSVNLSVDSVNPDIREKVLQRRMRADNVVERLRKVREYGIHTFVNYMLAVPESSVQDDLNTIKQGREGKISWQNYTTAVPMKGTPLFDYCVQHELLNPLTYVGDMSGCDQPAVLSCFTEREKRIRFNVFLLGDWIAKLPRPLGWLATQLIKVIPPNRLFRWFNARRYRHAMEHDIFVVKDNFRVPRFWKRSNNVKAA